MWQLPLTSRPISTTALSTCLPPRHYLPACRARAGARPPRHAPARYTRHATGFLPAHSGSTAMHYFSRFQLVLVLVPFPAPHRTPLTTTHTPFLVRLPWWACWAVTCARDSRAIIGHPPNDRRIFASACAHGRTRDAPTFTPAPRTTLCCCTSFETSHLASLSHLLHGFIALRYPLPLPGRFLACLPRSSSPSAAPHTSGFGFRSIRHAGWRHNGDSACAETDDALASPASNHGR